MSRKVIVVVLCVVGHLFAAYGQTSPEPGQYGDPDHYLVDSLQLKSLSELDKKIIDSCLFVFHSEKNDTAKLNGLSVLLDELWNENAWAKYNWWINDFVEKRLEKYPSELALEADAVHLYYVRLQSTTLNNIGYILDRQGKISQALEYYDQSLKIEERLGDLDGMATAYNNIGMIHMNLGAAAIALDYFYKSLKILESKQDKESMAVTFNNIGLVYAQQDDLEQALKYLLKSADLKEILGDQRGMATPYNNIGSIYRDLGNEKLALDYYHRSLLIREELDDKEGMAVSYNNIGTIHGANGDYQQALEFYEKSLKLYREIRNKKGVIISYCSIGSTYLDLDDVSKATQFGEQSLQLASELGYPDLIQRSAKLLSKCAIANGNYKRALEMRILDFQMHDSLANEAAIKATANQQAKYEYDKQKAIDDKEHENKLAIEHQEREKQQIISYAAGFSLLLVAGFLLFVFNRLRITKRQKLLIEKANSQITDSISYAKRIQDALLKSDKHTDSDMPEHFILFKPKDIVSGDFYWFMEAGDHLYVAAADCTGHGVPGAFLTMLGTSYLNEISSANELFSPNEILNILRDRVVKELSQTKVEAGDKISSAESPEVKDGMDISLMRLNLKSNELEWAGANNPLYILRHGQDDIQIVKGDKEPIGYAKSMTPFKNHTLSLTKGDILYLFSDGFADQFGGQKNKKFGYKPMRRLLVANAHKSMKEQKRVLNDTFDSWVAEGVDEQIDDVCVIGLQV